MMQCAPCSLNTDNYADIRRKAVVNTTITHKDISDVEQIVIKWVQSVIYLYFTKCNFHMKDKHLIESFCAG